MKAMIRRLNIIPFYSLVALKGSFYSFPNSAVQDHKPYKMGSNLKTEFANETYIMQSDKVCNHVNWSIKLKLVIVKDLIYCRLTTNISLDVELSLTNIFCVICVRKFMYKKWDIDTIDLYSHWEILSTSGKSYFGSIISTSFNSSLKLDFFFFNGCATIPGWKWSIQPSESCQVLNKM